MNANERLLFWLAGFAAGLVVAMLLLATEDNGNGGRGPDWQPRGPIGPLVMEDVSTH